MDKILEKAEECYPPGAACDNKRPREEKGGEGARKRRKPVNKCSKFSHKLIKYILL
jgi:hypothetical protein